MKKLVTMIIEAMPVIGAFSVSVFADDVATKTVSSWPELPKEIQIIKQKLKR